MKSLNTPILLLLLFATVAMGQEERYNPVPEYDPNASNLVYEIEYPHAVFSPTNDELFARFEALSSHSAVFPKPQTAEDEMKNLQKIYDSWLNIITEGNKDGESGAGNTSEEALAQLQWVVETAPVVEQYSPLSFKVSLKNISDHDVVIHDPYALESSFCFSSIRLVKKDSSEPRVVVRTPSLYYYYTFSRDPGSQKGDPKTLHPGDAYELGARGGSFSLVGNYDVSVPGEYELEFYTRRFCDKDGKPAKDEVRPYPAPCTTSFKVIPRQPHEAESEPLAFHYETKDEAQNEINNPAPERTPSNIEIAARYKALAAALSREDDKGLSQMRSMKDNYENCLDLLVEKQGIADPANRTEKFAGLQWRVVVPVQTKNGKAIIPQFGLENISEHDEYSIMKYDAMTATAILSSMKVHRRNEAGDWEDVRLTPFGTKVLYTTGPNVLLTVRFFSGGLLTPGRLLMTIKPLGAYGQSDFDLTKYWNLSQPGFYRLTFYTRRFLDKDGNPAEDQVRPFPKSDVVYFNITE